MHFLLHGCHHKHPMDPLRLVFPPAAAALPVLGLLGVAVLLGERTGSPSARAAWPSSWTRFPLSSGCRACR